MARQKTDSHVEFLNLIVDIGNDLASKIKYQRQNDYSSYLNKSINSVFTFKPVEAELISETIKNLTNTNSCGFDGINTNLLKIIEPAITKYLTILINQVLHVGVFPDKLKIAKVIPIYKKGTTEYLEIIDLSLFCQPFQKY